MNKTMFRKIIICVGLLFTVVVGSYASGNTVGDISGTNKEVICTESDFDLVTYESKLISSVEYENVMVGFFIFMWAIVLVFSYVLLRRA